MTERTTPRPDTEETLPPVAAWFQKGFHRFLRPYLRRHFDGILVARSNRLDHGQFGDQPLVVFSNHPSWWDPLIAHFLNDELLPGRQFRAPIDADALANYQVFERLGFFGVKSGTRRGSAAFLRTANQVLRSPNDVLWMTPEGRFADARDREATFMPGLAHVCQGIGRGHAVALALEFVFWNERLPVCLARFSEPVSLADAQSATKSELHLLLTETMRQTQDSLMRDAIARQRQPFDNFLVGRSGGGLVYDSFRYLKSLVTGQPFQTRHEPIDSTSIDSDSVDPRAQS